MTPARHHQRVTLNPRIKPRRVTESSEKKMETPKKAMKVKSGAKNIAYTERPTVRNPVMKAA